MSKIRDEMSISTLHREYSPKSLSEFTGAELYRQGFVAGWDSALLHDERVKALVESVTDFFHLMNQGLLVRDTSNDHDPNWALKAMSLVAKLKSADEALTQYRESVK